MTASTQTLLPLFADGRTNAEAFLPFEVIAHIFGISKQQVIRDHNRGLKKLRQLLADEEEGMSPHERAYPIGSEIEVREPGGKRWLRCRVTRHKPQRKAVVIENDPVWRGAELGSNNWRQVKEGRA